MFQRPSEKRYASITSEYSEAIQRGIPHEIRALGERRLHAALDMEENRIIPDITENIELIDADGDILFRRRAGLLGAKISKDQMASAKARGHGYVIMTHNHPALYSVGVIKQPPSWSDFRWAWSKGMGAIRATTATGTWEIKINCPHTQENFNIIQDLYVKGMRTWARWTKTNHPILHAKNPLREVDTGSAVISDRKGARYEYSKPSTDPLGIVWAELAIHAWTQLSKTGLVTFTYYPAPNMTSSLLDWGGMFVPGRAPAPAPSVSIPQAPRRGLSDPVVPVAQNGPVRYARRQL